MMEGKLTYNQKCEGKRKVFPTQSTLVVQEHA